MIQKMKRNFKCGIRMLSRTGHTIFASTHPRMYKYFNVPEEAKHLRMVAATTYIVLNNTIGRRIINKVFIIRRFLLYNTK